MYVLVVNAGSSSLKYQLFDTESGNVLGKGNCERIGAPDSMITHKKDGVKIEKQIEMPTHADAVKVVIDYLTDKEVGCIRSMDDIQAVGHRVVHGGPYFFQSVLVNDDVIAKLKLCYDFAPLHTKAHLMGLEGCMSVMPKVPQVLVFDTAFHQTMPEEAYFYPVSYDMYENYHIRRYGAHGTSHRFVSGEMTKIMGKTEGTKIITCHLGNGSSISAIKDGKCIDTSMGFTPLDGVEMGTRCGSIDPAIVTYIMDKTGMTPSEMSEYMNKKCGFLGITGFSDSRDVEKAAAEGNEKAILCTKILAYQIKKYIGAYTAAMGGLDAIVFTAGLGENNPQLRERVCGDLAWLGVEIDNEVNAKAHHQPDTIKLSTDASKVLVYLIPTNEELVIAKDTEALVNNK